MKANVKRSVICGKGTNREGFFGSDHCPILLELKEEKEGSDHQSINYNKQARLNG